MIRIRKVVRADLNALKEVLDSIELFPADMLEEMISDYLNNSESQDIWFTATVDKLPIAIGYCAPEKLTTGTYNLYAIGVRADIQGKKIGAQMMAYIEEQLKRLGGRILIVETSGVEKFKQTRNFYNKLNYTKEAIIRDFWEDGDDKVIYWKKLN